MARTKQTAMGTLGPRGTNIGRNLNWTNDDGGLSLLGADDVVTIPTAGANYTDAKTVASVQSALVKKGYDLGSSGPNSDGVDGIFGSKTRAAIKKLQTAINADVNGTIDEGVIAALRVTPGVLPPGVTMKGRAAVQAQAALDAATAAEHAATPSDAQSAAQQLVEVADAAAPPPPPEVKEKVAAAVRAAHAASTPAEMKAAVAQLVGAATDVHAAVAPPWYEMPTWDGGPPRWEAGAVAGAGAVGLGAILWGILR